MFIQQIYKKREDIFLLLATFVVSYIYWQIVNHVVREMILPGLQFNFTVHAIFVLINSCLIWLILWYFLIRRPHKKVSLKIDEILISLFGTGVAFLCLNGLSFILFTARLYFLSNIPIRGVFNIIFIGIFIVLRYILSKEIILIT